MKQRQSNMELLRIVSIIMVLAVHLDGASLGLPAPSCDISEVSARDWWCLAVESITIIGVNCFTLISGYFGIKASWRGLLKFSATCLFYSLGIYIGLIVTGLLQWSWSDFADSLMIFSHTDLWYVPAYLGVYILSPLLNAATEGLGQKRFAWTLAAFVLFNLYCGWWWGGEFNANGYTVVHLTMMYLIGRYIYRYGEGMARCVVSGRVWLSVYAVVSVFITIQAVYCDLIHTFAYNSPLVMLSSIAFFMLFTTIKINSRFINVLATSAFAVYLLHKNPYVWGNIIKPLSIYVWDNFTLWQFTAFVIVFIVLIYLITFLIDRLRIFLLSKLLPK